MKFLMICLAVSAAATVQGQYSTGNYQYSRDRASFANGFNKPSYAQRQASGSKEVVPRLIHRNKPVAIPVTKTQFNVMFNAHGYRTKEVVPRLIHRNQPVAIPVTKTQFNVMFSAHGYQGSDNINGYHGNANNDYQGNTAVLPLLFGMEHGPKQMATLGMMMNSRQGNNMLPFYMMNQGYEDMLPVMALMNRGNRRGQGMNTFMMLTLHDALN